MTIREMAQIVQPVFERQGWSWWNTDGEAPSVREIASTLQRLTDSAWDYYHSSDHETGSPIYIRSGRLSIIITEYDELGPEVQYNLELGHSDGLEY